MMAMTTVVAVATMALLKSKTAKLKPNEHIHNTRTHAIAFCNLRCKRAPPQTPRSVLLPFIKFISVIIYLVPCQWVLKRKAYEQINEYYFSGILDMLLAHSHLLGPCMCG